MKKKDIESEIKREIFATLWSETDNLHIEYIFKLIEELEEKAREEGKKEGIKQTKRKYENELRLYRSIQSIVKKWERKSEQLKKEFGISKLEEK